MNKVYIVKCVWRNDENFDCDIDLFSTKEKAKEFMEKSIKDLLVDFNIEDSDLDYSEDGAEYCSGDIDYFDIWVYEEAVK